MRLGVLRELKNIHKFFDNMERSVKTNNPAAVQRAYMFIKAMVVLMNDGELSPNQVNLNLQIEMALKAMEGQRNEQ